MGTKRLAAGLLLTLIMLAVPSTAFAGIDVTIDVSDREALPAGAPVMPKTGSDSLPGVALACAIAALGAAMLTGSRQSRYAGGER